MRDNSVKPKLRPGLPSSLQSDWRSVRSGTPILLLHRRRPCAHKPPISNHLAEASIGRQVRRSQPIQSTGRLLADYAIAVAIPHIRVGGVPPPHRCDAVRPRFRAADATIPVVIPLPDFSAA